VTLARKDAAVGIALLMLAGLYWFGARTIRVSLLEGGVGADALPKLLAVTLAFLACVLVAQSLWRARNTAEGGVEEEPASGGWRSHRRAVGMLLIGIGYVVLVETIGYAPAIAYLLAGVSLFVGGASWRTILPVAVIGALFFWVFFVEVLGIRQPKGFWPVLWHEIATFETRPGVQAGTPGGS